MSQNSGNDVMGEFAVAAIDAEALVPRMEMLVAESVTAANMPAFLKRVDDFYVDVYELLAGLTRVKDEDTSDKDARDAYLDFVGLVMPDMARLGDELNRKLLGVAGYEPPPDLAMAWSALRDDVELFRTENLPLAAEAEALEQRYRVLAGGLVVELDDEVLTWGQAQAKLEVPDRALRERAYRAMVMARTELFTGLDELFSRLMGVRNEMARNADLPNYRAMAWLTMRRRDYTPEDALRLHDAVEHEVVPRLRELIARRAKRLGVDRLRPWDLFCDVRGREPLKPFETVEELEEGLSRMFAALDPELGAAYELLRNGWMDLEPRPNKVPELGYQNYFPRSRRPYVYWSAVGTDDDLLTLRHEAGHAFHAVLTQNSWPYLWHLSRSGVMNELASQAMEFLTLPYLTREKGGFYNEEDARRSQSELMLRALGVLVRTSMVDAIEHFVYTHPSENGPSIAEIDAEWLRLTERFDLGVDYAGFEGWLAKGWQAIHVYLFPFYSIEYAIAYLGALQVWDNARDDAPQASAAYKAALSLGGTKPPTELYATAGVSFKFDEATIAHLVALALQAYGD